MNKYHSLLFIIYYLLFIIYYLLFINKYHSLLFIIYYLLFIIYYLLINTIHYVQGCGFREREQVLHQVF